MLLSRALQRSRERLVATREEERRRIRRDLHDGLGPALAGVALGLDAVTGPRARTRRPRPSWPTSSSARCTRRLADVRRLVEDLRPPALDQLGLVGAVPPARPSGSPSATPGSRSRSSATGVPPLPAAVEVAAYRIATEALTNVSRHAGARNCRVGIALDAVGSCSSRSRTTGWGSRPRRGRASA